MIQNLYKEQTETTTVHLPTVYTHTVPHMSKVTYLTDRKDRNIRGLMLYCK